MAVESQEDLAKEYAQQKGGESQADLAREYAAQNKTAEPQSSGFLPSVAQFVEGRSPWYQDSDPFWASMKQSVAPLNVAKNVVSGVKGAVKGAGEMGADLMSNPNWFQTMPAGQRPSTMQRFVTDPAREQVAKAQASPDTLEKAGHYAASALPLVGPWAASLGEQAGKGDVGGAAGQAAGGYLGTKGMGKAFDLAKETGDFMRRATNNEQVWEAASGHYKQVVQPQIVSLSEAMKREGSKTIDQAIQADRGAQMVQGRGTISLSQPIIEMAKKIEDTGYTPDAKMRSLQAQLTNNSMVTLEDAKNLRTAFGEAWTRARRANNAKAASIFKSGYDEIGEGMANRVEELQGSRDPYNHYNNEFKAHFELKNGVAGDMMDSIADRHEAIDKLKNFSQSSIAELQGQMKKYGLDPKKLADAQKQAQSIVAAHDSINGKLSKSTYRIILGGGTAAAAATTMYLAAKGLGASSLLPMALAAYAGSVASGLPPRIETGRLLQKYRMVPNASQVRTLVEGPKDFGYKGPEFEGFKGGGSNPPTTPMAGGLPSTATQAGANISNDFFSQAKEQMPNASLSEQLQAAAKMEKAARIQAANPPEVKGAESDVEQVRRGAAPERPHRSTTPTKMSFEDWEKIKRIEEIQARRGAKKAEMEKGGRR